MVREAGSAKALVVRRSCQCVLCFSQSLLAARLHESSSQPCEGPVDPPGPPSTPPWILHPKAEID